MDPQNGKYIKVRLCIPNLWHFLQQICFPLFFLKKHLWTNEDITWVMVWCFNRLKWQEWWWWCSSCVEQILFIESFAGRNWEYSFRLRQAFHRCCDMGPFCVRHCDLGSKPNSTNPFTKGKLQSYPTGLHWVFVGTLLFGTTKGPQITNKGFGTLNRVFQNWQWNFMDAKGLVCSRPQMDPNQNVRDHSYIQISGRTCMWVACCRRHLVRFMRL